MKIFRSSVFWTVFGSALATASLLFSAYQFYYSAQLNKRALLGGYVLEAHKSYTNLLSLINQHYKPPSATVQERVLAGDSSIDLVPSQVRVAYVNWEGAHSRAFPIDNKIIRDCLLVISNDVDTMLEVNMATGSNINVQERVLESYDLADVAVRYILGQAFLGRQTPKKRSENDDPVCAFLSDHNDNLSN